MTTAVATSIAVGRWWSVRTGRSRWPRSVLRGVSRHWYESASPQSLGYSSWTYCLEATLDLHSEARTAGIDDSLQALAGNLVSELEVSNHRIDLSAVDLCPTESANQPLFLGIWSNRLTLHFMGRPLTWY